MKEMRIRDGTGILEQLTGALLVLVGLGFIVLLAFLKRTDQLPGDLKVSVFMVGTGTLLIWIGCRFLRRGPEQSKALRRINVDSFLLKLRPAGELIAAIGCVLMLCHITSVLRGTAWPPEPLFEMLLIAPVVIGLFGLKILVPGAFQSGLFPDTAVQNWSSADRRLVNALIQTGWLGYLAIPLVWPDIVVHIRMSVRVTAEVIACSLISVLYASQFVVLHFGNMRQQSRTPYQPPTSHS